MPLTIVVGGQLAGKEKERQLPTYVVIMTLMLLLDAVGQILDTQ